MNPEEQQVQHQIITAIDAELPMQVSFHLFRIKLAAYISELINDDFEKLVRLLYRLDVSEKKLKTLLTTEVNADTGNIIADLIIERQLQKIQTRKQFSQPDEVIPDEDEW